MSESNNDEVAKGEYRPQSVDVTGLADALEDTGVANSVFRNKILAMFTASPKPSNGMNDASEGKLSGLGS
jgi:hypothetical protein